ncbi:MAG: 30S ribosome-binding factor RbfA [candidate division Zixibacteria bacterium]|nr:30S ribosome-binding factor RbfA [candidate division Zixibacteria bacterium]
MKPADRNRRVAEEMQRVVAETLHRDIKDFDLRMVTVIRCELARDFSEVIVRYSVLGNEDMRRQCATTLSKVAGFVQRQVGLAIKLHRVPHVRFQFDASIEEGLKLEQLFDRITRERNADQ